jgi:hypothetical protein
MSLVGIEDRPGSPFTARAREPLRSSSSRARANALPSR